VTKEMTKDEEIQELKSQLENLQSVCNCHVNKIETMTELLGLISANEYAEGNGVTHKIQAKRGVMEMISSSLLGVFKSNGGINYTAYDVTDGETGEKYELVMQRKSGKTPSEMYEESIKERNTLMDKLRLCIPFPIGDDEIGSELQG